MAFISKEDLDKARERVVASQVALNAARADQDAAFRMFEPEQPDET